MMDGLKSNIPEETSKEVSFNPDLGLKEEIQAEELISVINAKKAVFNAV